MLGEFLEVFVEFFTIGSERSNIRTMVFLAILLIVAGFIIYQVFFVESSGSGEVTRRDVEDEIKQIDKAIAKFYKEQFTLPEDVEQLIDFAYIEKTENIWKEWKFSFEGDGNAITGIKGSSD